MARVKQESYCLLREYAPDAASRDAFTSRIG